MKVDLIRSIPLFSTLTDDEFNQLAHIFVARAYRKNQVIFLEEETGSYMYVVLSGKLKIAKAGAGGKETILAIHRTGDFLARCPPDGLHSAVSAMGCKIISVSSADFHKYLLHNEKVMQIIQVCSCARWRPKASVPARPMRESRWAFISWPNGTGFMMPMGPSSIQDHTSGIGGHGRCVGRAVTAF
jgi:hypothetical protein